MAAVCLVPAGALPQSAVAAAQPAAMPQNLAGRWLVTLIEADGVELQFRMTFEDGGRSGEWEAYSRAGAAREMVGGGTAALGRLFGKMPPHEALITMRGTTAAAGADPLRLDGTLDSPFMGKRSVTGKFRDGVVTAELRRQGSAEIAGTLRAVRDSGAGPVRDYGALAAALERTITGAIFDPRLPGSAPYRKFFQELAARFNTAKDDLDAVAAFQRAKPMLATSHVEFIRNPRLAGMPREAIIAGNASAEPAKLVSLNYFTPSVAFLRVQRWDRRTGPSLERAFEQLDKQKPRVLVIDIRGNPGGDATSMVPLAYLLSNPTPVGMFYGRGWFQNHDRPPSPPDRASMPTLSSADDPMRMFETLRTHGAVKALVQPRRPRFEGDVYLLVDKRTASASEPLAHLLKTTGRATLIGERTAGAMLTALPHGLPDGWIVTVPEADFITADATRLEGAGVTPHIPSESNEVYLRLADRLAPTDPFSAALIRGGSLSTLGRPAEAERAYREALRVADAPTSGADPASRATVHKSLAILLAKRGDRAGARGEYEKALRLVPGDAAAREALEKLRDTSPSK
jgi:hypothetical protein